MKRKIVVLIPAYEPTSKLLELLMEVKEYVSSVVVVNDGSGSNYDDIFVEVSREAIVLKHDINRGKGAALKTGLQYIVETLKDNYVVVTMDCDGQHQVRDALKLGNYSMEHPKELVLGKRLRSKKTPLRSRMGNMITRFIYRMTTGLDVYDTQTGLRAFSEQLVPYMLKVEGERFEYEMNVLLEAARDNLKIIELEIETIYFENNSHSHFKVIRDSLLIYKEIGKFLLSSGFCFIIDYFLYSVLLGITSRVVLSNVMARLVSASVNYNLNRRKVFVSSAKGVRTVVSYFGLATVILLLNTFLLWGLIDWWGVNQYVAKIVVELVLLSLSWGVQKKLIFGKSDREYVVLQLM